MRAERIGQENRFAAIGTYGNDFPFLGLKSRAFDRIRSELRQSLGPHRLYGSALGGVPFGLTGHDVTECVGGPQDLQVSDLSRSYETFCDPRLNYAQSLELAFLVAQHIGQARDGHV